MTADALAFYIPQNVAGGFLGLELPTNHGALRNQTVHVEFDSRHDEWDPHDVDNHVGINNNSLASSKYTYWNASLHSGDTADVWITYNASTKNLSVSWSYRKSSDQQVSSLSLVIDLMQVLPEKVVVGFSASTGFRIEHHQLKSWEFSSSLKANSNFKKKVRVAVLVGLAVLTGFLITGAILAGFISRGVKQEKERTETMSLPHLINDEFERGAGPRRFPYRDLVLATNNFSDERKLGQGGFGAVYKGHLTDLDMEVAVKKISRGSKQGLREYVTEVKVISLLRHKNLVQLIGWCHDGGEFILVYEFMPNGSLDKYLFGHESTLIWPVRYKVSIGLATALLYLHEEWEQCVVHRDIKSSNIMLDSSFNVKLSDFGLARLLDHELYPHTTALAGTLGYMAPEYISTGRPSKESDVYSFGVVVLEIVTGRKSVDPERLDLGLVEWVWDLYGNGLLLSAVDKRLQNEFDVKQVECLLMVGLWCAYPVHTLRPSIRQAIHVLNFEAAIPDLPVQMPVPVYHIPGTSPTPIEHLMSISSLEIGR